MNHFKEKAIEASFIILISIISSYVSYRFAISESNDKLNHAIEMKKIEYEYNSKNFFKDGVKDHNNKIEESYVNISKIFGQIRTALYKSNMLEVEQYCNEFEKENAKLIINCKDKKTRDVLIESAILIRQLAYSYEYADKASDNKGRIDLNNKLLNYYKLYLSLIPLLKVEIDK